MTPYLMAILGPCLLLSVAGIVSYLFNLMGTFKSIRQTLIHPAFEFNLRWTERQRSITRVFISSISFYPSYRARAMKTFRVVTTALNAGLILSFNTLPRNRTLSISMSEIVLSVTLVGHRKRTLSGIRTLSFPLPRNMLPSTLIKSNLH